jgi:CPA2 family monovalent cation:H+ antiporter-2
MPHETALLVTIAAGLGLAFVLGLVAARLGLPPLVGYLLAGVAIGPFSPGYVADTGLAAQLAEVGVILLMFGVGLHFSPRDLLAARRVALPGALAQMTLAAALGYALAAWWGWPTGAAVVYGLSLSVASTVVVLKSLEARGLLDSAHGRTAIGWLVVEDLAMVLALVLVPALAGGGGSVLGTVALTIGKVALFVALMTVVGRRVVPWLLASVARTGSRELFTLGVLAVALGIATGAAALFGVSFALGAFFAGVVISESDLSYQAGADALPLQDAFAVLFFVSVGMLFDPMVLVREPQRVLATVGVIIVGNAVVALLALVALRYPTRPALQIAASLGQVGEFSFILAGLGVSSGLLPAEGRSLVLAGALVSITINPLLVAAVNVLDRWLDSRPHVAERLARTRAGASLPIVADDAAERSTQHAIVVGAGRVGSTIIDALGRHGFPCVVVEQDRHTAEALRARGVPVIYGDAARPAIFAHAHAERARLLVVATPASYHGRQIIELARARNPDIDIVVRTHSREEQGRFERLGVGRAVMGERELALGMADYALRALGCDDDTADATIGELRAVG